jgi:Phosphoesterase family
MSLESGSGNLEKIDTIVVVMLENRSFDQMLGYLSLEKGRHDIDDLQAEFENGYAGRRYPCTISRARGSARILTTSPTRLTGRSVTAGWTLSLLPATPRFAAAASMTAIRGGDGLLPRRGRPRL